MNVVDSSGWLEYLVDGSNADAFEQAIRDISKLVVPVISIYEVYKKFLQERSADEARIMVASMEQGLVVELNSELAFEAARLSLKTRLSMADSVILATAYANKATLWTQDADFEGLPGVKYCPR